MIIHLLVHARTALADGAFALADRAMMALVVAKAASETDRVTFAAYRHAFGCTMPLRDRFHTVMFNSLGRMTALVPETAP